MASEMRPRYCAYCGQPTAPGWRHCPGCGRQLESMIPEQTDGGSRENRDGVAADTRWDDALIRFRLGELDKANDLLSSLMQDYPQNAHVLALYGSICVRQYRIEEARQYLEKAEALAPTSAFVRLKMAEYWLALGIPTRAFEEIARAEADATEDIPLLLEIRSFSKELRAKTRGNVLREPPALPQLRFPGIMRWIRPGSSATFESKQRTVAK